METVKPHEPWNKGKLVGQKPPLKLKDILAIRIHLQLDKRIRDLALFNLAVDSKLRGCNLVNRQFRATLTDRIQAQSRHMTYRSDRNANRSSISRAVSPNPKNGLRLVHPEPSHRVPQEHSKLIFEAR